jgi:hypothetical protein
MTVIAPTDQRFNANRKILYWRHKTGEPFINRALMKDELNLVGPSMMAVILDQLMAIKAKVRRPNSTPVPTLKAGKADPKCQRPRSR